MCKKNKTQFKMIWKENKSFTKKCAMALVFALFSLNLYGKTL